MKKIVERRRLKKMDVRDICIENGLYTKGTNAEYDWMFARWDSDLDVSNEKLEEIARDIWEHSDQERLMDDGWEFNSVMYVLAKRRVSFFDEVEIDELDDNINVPINDIRKTLNKYFTSDFAQLIAKDMLKHI